MCNHGAADIIGIGRSYKTRCRESEFRDSNGSDMVAAEKNSLKIPAIFGGTYRTVRDAVTGWKIHPAA